MNHFFSRWVCVGLFLFVFFGLSACAVGPEYHVPDVSGVLEKDWQASQSDRRFPADQQPTLAWWNQFHDDQLNTLVTRLFSSSLPLAQARQRIVEISAQHGVVAANRYVQLAAALGYTHATAGDQAVTLQGPPPGFSKDIYTAGMAAGWELDLWGRTARLVEAAEADIDTGYAEYQGMRVSLAAEVTLAYCGQRALEAQLLMVQRAIALQEKALGLAQDRYLAGNGSAVAVARAQTVLQASRARIPELAQARAAVGNRIKVLLGLPPSAPGLAPGPLPSAPPMIGLGLPVDLLTRRPDIQAAFHRYHGAVARIGAAKAERYPRLSLAGVLTFSSDAVKRLADKDSLVYSLEPGLSVPLFTGGRVTSTIAVRSAQAKEAELALRQTIVAALAEVENGIEGVVRSQQRVHALTLAEETAAESVALAENLYHSGLEDFFQVLDSQQQEVAVQESLFLARQQALAQVVYLYRALGGGWQEGVVADNSNAAKVKEKGVALVSDEGVR